jgi:hypothetical protein
MGRRLMREWIGRPLLDIGCVNYNGLEIQLIDSALQARIDAIEEIINEKTYHMEQLRGLLVNIPDLVKGLTRIQYGKVRILPRYYCNLTWTGPTYGSSYHPHQLEESRRRIQIRQRRAVRFGTTQQYLESPTVSQGI